MLYEDWKRRFLKSLFWICFSIGCVVVASLIGFKSPLMWLALVPALIGLFLSAPEFAERHNLEGFLSGLLMMLIASFLIIFIDEKKREWFPLSVFILLESVAVFCLASVSAIDFETRRRRRRERKRLLQAMLENKFKQENPNDDVEDPFGIRSSQSSVSQNVKRFYIFLIPLGFLIMAYYHLSSGVILGTRWDKSFREVAVLSFICALPFLFNLRSREARQKVRVALVSGYGRMLHPISVLFKVVFALFLFACVSGAPLFLVLNNLLTPKSSNHSVRVCVLKAITGHRDRHSFADCEVLATALDGDGDDRLRLEQVSREDCRQVGSVDVTYDLGLLGHPIVTRVTPKFGPRCAPESMPKN